VYCGGAGGLYILDPAGEKLGRIVRGQPAMTNIGFGCDDLRTLFFASQTHLGSVNIKIAGIPAPPSKKTRRGRDKPEGTKHEIAVCSFAGRCGLGGNGRAGLGAYVCEPRVGEARDVVHHHGAGGERGARDIGLPRVDGHGDPVRGEPLDERHDPPRLLVSGDRGSIADAGLSAYVDERGSVIPGGSCTVRLAVEVADRPAVGE